MKKTTLLLLTFLFLALPIASSEVLPKPPIHIAICDDGSAQDVILASRIISDVQFYMQSNDFMKTYGSDRLGTGTAIIFSDIDYDSIDDDVILAICNFEGILIEGEDSLSVQRELGREAKKSFMEDDRATFIETKNAADVDSFDALFGIEETIVVEEEKEEHQEQIGEIPIDSTAEDEETQTIEEYTIINCGTDFICFIDASENCELSNVLQTQETTVFGVSQTTTSYFEIRGLEEEKCIFYIRTEKIDVVFPEQLVEELKSSGLSEEEIKNREEMTNSQSDVLEGRDGICKFRTEDLFAMLDRWNKNILSTEDWKGVDCDGRFFGRKLSEEGEACNGCIVKEQCNSYGHRSQDRYCDFSRTYIEQEELGKTCSYGYECISNICEENTCKSSNIFSRFFRWLKGIFS